MHLTNRTQRLAALLAAASAGALAVTDPASAGTWLVTSQTTLSDTDLSHEGDDVIVEGTTLYVNGAHSFASLTVRRNAGNQPGTLRHDMGFSNATVNGCWLTIAGDVTIEGPSRGLVGSKIDLWAGGFPPQSGPGLGAAAWAASGGGHAGHGGAGQGTSGGGSAYGSFTQPAEFGSGGGYPSCCGSGGWGGGSIRLVVGGEVRVDGAIIANGSVGGNAAGWGGGGGAGGSVWIECSHLTGAGTMTANGGNAAYDGTVGGGGGGGRISLNYAASTFIGTVTALGGIGAQRGGAGSIYMHDTDEAASAGVLIYDNGGAPGARTPWCGPTAFDGSMIVRGAAALGVADPAPLALTFGGDVTVESSGLIGLTGYGEAPQAGPGAGAGAWAASGGGYGGHGGAGGGTSAGGASYGSFEHPSQLGSGGGHPSCCGSGGSGGGALRLTVNGQLRVDGAIAADGSSGGQASGWGGGAGSGGSIWIECDHFTGIGDVRANGGEGAYGNIGGGGGGGRVAVHSNRFTYAGQLRAQGGVGAQGGGPGSVFVKQIGASSGELIYDNGGLTGATTEWTSSEPVVADVTVRNGAVLSAQPGQTLHVQVVGSLHVGNGGRIDVTGHGFPPLEGPGTACAGAGGGGQGGGYGGGGGLGTNADCGGNVYGSATQPTDFGSGGGGTRCCNPGGWGGGALRITVSDVLEVNGVVCANGGPGQLVTGWGGGGGSGGSVWLECNQLIGTGEIQAIGGDGGGQDLGGGGGGGRIAMCGQSMSQFTGLIRQGGGGGLHAGEPGSVYKHFADDAGGYSADLDGNGTVNGADLGILLSTWGCVDASAECGECHGADLNGNGVVDGADLGALLADWTM